MQKSAPTATQVFKLNETIATYTKNGKLFFCLKGKFTPDAKLVCTECLRQDQCLGQQKREEK